MVRHHIALGQWFAAQVAADERFEVATPPRFGLTCFRLRGVDNAANKQLLDNINAVGGSLLEVWLWLQSIHRLQCCLQQPALPCVAQSALLLARWRPVCGAARPFLSLGLVVVTSLTNSLTLPSD